MLASLSLVKGSEGNLSTFDGGTFCITRTGAELEAFCDRLERFFDYAIRELGATPVTYRDFRERWIRN